MKKLSIVIVVICISSIAKAGGPWPQGKGNGYFKLSLWGLVFDEHFTDTGERDPNVTTGIFNTALYAEYGFTNRITGVAYFPVYSRSYMNNIVSGTTGETITEGESINTIGDAELGLKYTFTKASAKVPISAMILLGLPVGEEAGGSQGNLQTGDGEFNQMIRVDAGTSFKMMNTHAAYVSGFGGLNNRTEGFSDEVRYGAEFGLAWSQDRLWTIFRLEGVESLRNGDTAETTTSTSIFANNTEYTSYGLEVAYKLNNKWGISASFASVFRGEIIAAAPSYSVGVFYDLK